MGFLTLTSSSGLRNSHCKGPGIEGTYSMGNAMSLIKVCVYIYIYNIEGSILQLSQTERQLQAGGAKQEDTPDKVSGTQVTARAFSNTCRPAYAST